MFADLKVRLGARWTRRMVLDRRWLAELAALACLVTAAFARDTRRKLSLLVKGARRTETAVSRALARSLLRPWLADPAKRIAWREHRIGWAHYEGGDCDITRDRALKTTLLLKAPGPGGEKGVLYSSFEANWMKLVAHHDVQRILSRYLLVGASSWSPGEHAVLATLQGLSDDPVFVGISNHYDLVQYRLWEAGGGIVPIALTAGDWVDPAMHRPRPADERDIDIVMVSHFAKWKRHWLLFEALRRMPEGLRVVVVGRDADGRTEDDIVREARAFGVRQHLDVYKNLEIDEVSDLQSRARAAVALSRREGSCVAVTEAMFADTPVVMMDDAHVGTRAYINERTGRIASRTTLPHRLMEVIDRRAPFSPRLWAIENISAEVSSRKLNARLRDHCISRGKPWTRDITPLCWRYVPQYLDRADEARMAPAVNALRLEHGVRLARFEGERRTAVAAREVAA